MPSAPAVADIGAGVEGSAPAYGPPEAPIAAGSSSGGAASASAPSGPSAPQSNSMEMGLKSLPRASMLLVHLALPPSPLSPTRRNHCQRQARAKESKLPTVFCLRHLLQSRQPFRPSISHIAPLILLAPHFPLHRLRSRRVRVRSRRRLSKSSLLISLLRGRSERKRWMCRGMRGSILGCSRLQPRRWVTRLKRKEKNRNCGMVARGWNIFRRTSREGGPRQPQLQQRLRVACNLSHQPKPKCWHRS